MAVIDLLMISLERVFSAYLLGTLLRTKLTKIEALTSQPVFSDYVPLAILHGPRSFGPYLCAVANGRLMAVCPSTWLSQVNLH